jgi:hypothetical protein
MSQGDTTHQEVHARRGADDLATIGLTRFDVAGIRFLDGEGGANPTGGQESDDTDSEQESDAADAQGADGGDIESGDSDEDDEDGPEFDGPFDAPRARRAIRMARQRLQKARAERDAAITQANKNAPEWKQLQSENMRLKVALSTGLDADLAERLRGDTEDELLEDAQKLLDRFYPENKKPEPRQPKPAPRGGARPGAEPELTADDVVKAALAR